MIEDNRGQLWKSVEYMTRLAFQVQGGRRFQVSSFGFQVSGFKFLQGSNGSQFLTPVLLPNLHPLSWLAFDGVALLTYPVYPLC
jgi:hypothetical protein